LDGHNKMAGLVIGILVGLIPTSASLIYIAIAGVHASPVPLVIIAAVLNLTLSIAGVLVSYRELNKPLLQFAGVMERVVLDPSCNDPIPFKDLKGGLGLMSNVLERCRAEMRKSDVAARIANNARSAQESVVQRRAEDQAHVVTAVASALANLADGKLATRIRDEFPDDYQQLKHHFNKAVDKLQEALRGVALSSSGVRAGVEEMSGSVTDLSSRTESQAATLEETAATLNQITQAVRVSAEGTAGLSLVTLAAKADAEGSSEVVRGTIAAMVEIERSAEEISKIIGVIDEIAFQTNLLALNAGVEAARAGDAGRGFAVVAAEVRALAQRSAGAAKEIKALISTSSVQVKDGVRLVGETGASLERIVGKVGEINQLVAEIAVSAKEQALSLNEINSSINQMDRTTQQNAAMVEETTAACTALADEARQLSALIGRFEIGEASDSSRLTVVRGGNRGARQGS
jgi:methyl-accepting chemotaxis protein